MSGAWKTAREVAQLMGFTRPRVSAHIHRHRKELMQSGILKRQGKNYLIHADKYADWVGRTRRAANKAPAGETASSEILLRQIATLCYSVSSEYEMSDEEFGAFVALAFRICSAMGNVDEYIIRALVDYDSG